MEAEQQLVNEKTLLQKMLEEIEGLEKQNIELQNERDKNIRNLQDSRLWLQGMASSNNRSNNNVTKLTYDELKKGTNGFEDSLQIGEGGSARVYKGFLRQTSVAIKVLKRQSYQESEFTHEVNILRGVRHPNLVVLMGVCPEARALVYEFMPNGTLQDLLKKRPRSLTWKTRICIASNICSGLIFLHSVNPHGIVHGDLKPANILLDSNYIGKLSDFGISRHLSQNDTRITPHHQTEFPKGTLPYMDPEYFQSGELTPQYDVYSFGIVLLELVTAKDPRGLRKLVEDAIQKGELKKFVDPSAGKWPFEEAKKMVLLGLRCSDISRKNRPDLVTEVWYEIELMKHVALSH
ncbi:U-box domain-containing protein kinase family protein [Rhynchospora pubera]|uniref:RING-type E3 ubiquitin transferase n=1 Tax=Rhynchospora pubera TaxID=906938 RepID=A0AAV8EFN6_9POAL|nr:U-box domain-containing protein kinase family protein [Rhynchospora pubera]